jgi:multiple sugar transport system permease protein
MTRVQTRLLPIFLAPALLMILVFTLAPGLWAVYVSFTNLALAGSNALNYKFIGLDNFIRLFSDEEFYHSLVLTLLYTLYTTVGQFVLGMGAALLLSRRKFIGKTFLLAVIILPMVIPGLIQALLWSSMLANKEFGTINRIIALVGISPVSWTQQFPLISVVLVNFWNNAGFAMILFLAGLESISQDVLESAQMDGANGWQMLVNIKIPLIRYMIMLWMLLNTLGCLGVFDLVYALTRGGPGNATEILGIYIFNRGFRFFELGYGSAASLVLLFISLFLAFIYMRMMRVDLE